MEKKPSRTTQRKAGSPAPLDPSRLRRTAGGGRVRIPIGGAGDDESASSVGDDSITDPDSGRLRIPIG